MKSERIDEHGNTITDLYQEWGTADNVENNSGLFSILISDTDVEVPIFSQQTF